MADLSNRVILTVATTGAWPSKNENPNVPITPRERFAGESKYGVWNRLFKSFTDLLAVRWMKSRQLRYRIAERKGFPS